MRFAAYSLRLAAIRARRRNRRGRLQLSTLEARINPTSSTEIFSAFNSGLDDWSTVAPSIAAQGMGADVPIVKQNFSDQLNIGDRLKQIISAKIANPQMAIDEARAALQQAGWTVSRLDTTPDATGRLLEVSERISVLYPLSFDIGGTTGFNYFDDRVTGELTGRLVGSGASGVLDVTMGVDLIGGSPTFYIGDGTNIAYRNVTVSGTASGKLQIRDLANVQARGSVLLTADLAQLGFQDRDSDHRIRLDDLQNHLTEVVTGDVHGSVKFNDVNFTAKLSRLPSFKFKGAFNTTFANGQSGPDTSQGIQAPDPDVLRPTFARGFLDNLGSNNLLGSIRDKLSKKLPIIKKSILDLGNLEGSLKWIGDLLKVSDSDLAPSRIEQKLNDLGISLNINADTVRELVQGNPVDLMTFQRSGGDAWDKSLYDWQSQEFGWPPLLSGSIQVTAHLAGSWSWNVGAGISTKGVWFQEGSGVDVTLNPWVEIKGTAKVLSLIKVATLSGRTDFIVSAYAHLSDPSPGDGKVYLNEIVSDKGNLFKSIIDSFDAGVIGKLHVKVHAHVKLGIKTIDKDVVDRDYPLFNFVQKARLGVLGDGAQPVVPITFADGTLSISGTDGNDRVQLSATGTTTTVRIIWKDANGNMQSADRTFEQVREVQFDGGEGNDIFDATDYPIPVWANGGPGNDVLRGGSAADLLVAGSGGEDDADTLIGGSGDDTLTGNDGSDVLQGNDGNDTLTDAVGDNTLDGGAGADTITDGPGDSRINGADGDDTVNGGDGDNAVDLGVGNDRYTGGAGVDDVNGGDGNDVLQLGDGENIGYGGTGGDTITAGAGNDLLVGDAGNDSITAGAGDDTVQGGDGADMVDAGLGNDFVAGEAGNDFISGGDGEDVLLGGDGDDVLRGGRGNDGLDGGSGTNVVDGQQGEDVIAIAPPEFGGGVSDKLKGGFDKDTLAVLGTAGDDRITVRQVNSKRYGVGFGALNGPIRVEILVDLPGDIELLSIEGGAGNDRITVASGVNKNLILDGGDGNDVIVGGKGNDSLVGGDGDDSLSGAGGSDDIRGGDGNDTIDGGAGSDNLMGDAGADLIRGGGDHDLMSGGDGDDRLEAGKGTYGVLAAGDAGNDLLIGGDGVDVLMGGDGNDLLIGGALLDVLLGGNGDDRLEGDAGRDFIFGDAGDDTLRAFSNDAWRQEAGLPLVTADLTSTWTSQYQDFLNREEAVFHRLQELELKEATEGLTDDDLAERQRLSDELTVLNLAEIDTNPYQKVQVDLLYGAAGNDDLTGSQYPDILFGGSDDDMFHYSPGDDTVQGGDGSRDVYAVDGTTGPDNVSIRYESTEDHPDAVYVTVNGISTRVDLPGIDVAGVYTGDGPDHVTMAMGQQALLKAFVDLGAGDDNFDGSGYQAGATVLGGSGNDVITGGLSDDSLDGGSGDDIITGGLGYDTVNGGDGNDDLVGDDRSPLSENGGNDTIDGGAGDDRIIERWGDNSISGGDGNDSIQGGTGADSILAGAGDDTVFGWDGNDTIRGGSGNDSLQGGDGVDQDVLDGEDGNDTVLGSQGNDVLNGGEGDDLMSGYIGDDVMYGEGGNDTMGGHAGGDYVNAGDGDDLLLYDRDDNALIGGSGQDTLRMEFQSGGTFVVYQNAIVQLNVAAFGISQGQGLETIDFDTGGFALNVLRGAGVGPNAMDYGISSIPVSVDGVMQQPPPYREAAVFSIMAHMELFGDINYNWDSGSESTLAGMPTSSRRLEGFLMKFNNPSSSLGLQYMTSLDQIGDTGWADAGTFVGTRQQSRRLGGLAAQLTGAESAFYDVRYRVSLVVSGGGQNHWSDWVSNGTYVGYNSDPDNPLPYFIEAIQVSIVPK